MEVIWPPPNSAADALVARYLTRVAPGWSAGRWADLSGDDALTLLWTWVPLFKGLGEPRPDPRAEPVLDAALERMADGAAFDFASLEATARQVLHARLTVALAGASMARMTPGPVMRLPLALSGQQRLHAVSIRALYQAPLSPAGLG